MTCWVGNASKQDENSLDNETKKAGGEGGGEARKHRHGLSPISDKQTEVEFV